MLIEFNFGPHAGQSEHIPDTAVATLLVKAGVLKLVEETPQPKTLHPANAVNAQLSNVQTEHTWTAGLSAYGTPTIYFLSANRRTELSYDGPPPGAVENFKRSGFDLPAETLRDYTTLYNRHDPEAQAERQRNAQEAGRR
jgi:hypothetical protein